MSIENVKKIAKKRIKYYNNLYKCARQKDFGKPKFFWKNKNVNYLNLQRQGRNIDFSAARKKSI